MLYEYLRVFKSSPSLTDLSILNQDQASNISVDLGLTKYLYLGQYYPFNNIFFYINTPNAVSANLVVEYWNNKEWVNAVDVLDATSTAGVCLAKSGVVQFQPERKDGWVQVEDTSEGNAPSELSSLKVYDCYWLRVSASADITVSLKEVSYAFTTTEKLNDLYIEVSGFYESFGTGKTDWIREIMTSSKMVLSDLKRLGLVVHQGQILRFDDVSMATDMKTLELIYMNLGSSYNERKAEIRSLYQNALNSRSFTFDTNNDGRVDRKEINSRVKVMDR